MSRNKLLKYGKFDHEITYFLWTIVKISVWLKFELKFVQKAQIWFSERVKI